MKRCVFLIFVVLVLAAAPAVAEKLPVRTYTVIDGLGDDSVRGILCDSRGFVWLCTRQGLSRFDGRSFTNYDVREGLTHPSLQDMLEVGDGTFLLQGRDGLVRFDPRSDSEQFEPIEPASDTPVDVNVMHRSRDGKIYVAGSSGLFVLLSENGSYRFRKIDLDLYPPGTPKERTAFAMEEDRDGNLWIGHKGGLTRLHPDGSTTRYGRSDGLPHDDVICLLEDRHGTLWVGTTLGVARLTRNPAVRIEAVPIDINDPWVHAMLESRDGSIWVAIDGVLAHILPDGRGGFVPPRVLTSAHGLPTTEIGAMAEDARGNLWLGTTSSGVWKVAQSGLVSWAESEGLVTPRIAALVEAKDGTVCALTGILPNHISCLAGDGFKLLKPNLPPGVGKGTWGWGQISFQDHAGEWWIATGQGLVRYPAVYDPFRLEQVRPKAVYTERDGLPGSYIFRLFEDSAHDIWIGLSTAEPPNLVRWERATGKFHPYMPQEGLPFNSQTGFVEDRHGAIWIGLYNGGVSRYRDGVFQQFGVEHGAPPGAGRGLHLDSKGRVWIAAAGGLGRIDEPGADVPLIRSYSMDDGLSSDLISCVTEDLEGRIYIGTSRGVDRLNPDTGSIRHFTTADGLPNSFVNAAMRDRHGRLWFGTLGGVARLTPGEDPAQAVPTVFITSLRIAGRPQPVSALGETAVELANMTAGSGPVEISFLAPGEGMHYRYRMDGAEGGWSELSDQRTVHLAGLASGDYNFQVLAVGQDGAECLSPASVRFTVVPPLWLRWWFLTLVVLAVAAAAVTAHRIRMAGVRRHAEALREAERMAAYGTMVASVAHEVRHPIFSLKIAAYVLMERLKGNRELDDQLRILDRETKRMSALMDDLLEFARPPELAPAETDPARLLHEAAEEFAVAHQGDSPAAVAFDIEDGIGRVNLDPARMLQVLINLMENAQRHAEGLTTITLAAEAQDGAVIIGVADDGAGIPDEIRPHIFEPFRTGGKGTGLGLSIVQRVVEDHGGSIRVGDNGGSGTVFRITIPCHLPESPER